MPPQGYGQPPYPGSQQPGVGERASEAMHSLERHIRTPETKPFFKTSEFMVWVLTVVGVLIAGAAVGDSDNGNVGDVLRANTVWILITATSFAYIVSRGISKAATRYRDDDRSLHGGRGY
jgi:hypothetical protein